MSAKLRRFLCAILVLLEILLTSCGEAATRESDFKETFRWEVEETGSESAGGQTGELEYDEEAYHRNMGIEPLDESYRDHISDYYDVFTQDGLSSYVADSLYRVKLEFDKLKAQNYFIKEYSEISALIETYLQGKEVKYLLPALEIKDGRPQFSVMSDVYRLLEMTHEAQVETDEDLVNVYRYYLYLELQYYRTQLSGNTKEEWFRDLVFPPKISHVTQHYDEKMGRTLLTVEGEGIERVAYQLDGNPISIIRTHCFILDKDEVFSLPPNYSGPISIAAVDEFGLLGEAYTYVVTSETDKVPNYEVAFQYEALEKKVREHLGKSGGDAIMSQDLLGITSIFITANDVYINDEGITLDVLNSREEEKEQKICLADFDHFYGLNSLKVQHHAINKIEGERVRYVRALQFFNCGLNDLSFLKGGTVQSLSLPNNRIKDATCLAELPTLYYVDLKYNPLTSLALPEKAMYYVSIGYTEMKSLDFLWGVTSVDQLWMLGAPIEDFDMLFGVYEIGKLYLPKTANQDIVKKLSCAKEIHLEK